MNITNARVFACECGRSIIAVEPTLAAQEMCDKLNTREDVSVLYLDKTETACKCGIVYMLPPAEVQDIDRGPFKYLTELGEQPE
jgi:hypothetical protein